MPPAKKQMVVKRLPMLSCAIPLTPWPLVHPPARRMPKSKTALPRKVLIFSGKESIIAAFCWNVPLTLADILENEMVSR